jgi:predicted acetyltransferase
MEVILKRIPLGDKPVLARLFELYRYDLSEYDGAHLSRHGLYGYRFLDHYWTEKGRHPFFIITDGVISGFLLVSDTCCLCGPGEANSIAEFFILRKYRRKGIGRAAAVSAFKMFPGKWEVVQHPDNKPSMNFWENVIEDVSRGQFRKLEAETDTWTGQALIFTQS